MKLLSAHKGEQAQALRARLTSLRGLTDKYRDSVSTLRPYWVLVVPLLIWQARRAYAKELRQQRALLASEAQATAAGERETSIAA